MTVYSRRTFIKKALGFASAGALLAVPSPAYALDFNSDQIEKTFLKLRYPNLPKSFESYRIGFVSDLHLGPLVTNDLIADAIRMLNDEKPDLIILGGDYVGVPDNIIASTLYFPKNKEFDRNYSPNLIVSIYKKLHQIMSGLEAKDGIFSVLGNHDHWNMIESCIQSFKESKIELLTNSSRLIKRGKDNLKVICSDDFLNGIPNLDGLDLSRNKNNFNVFVSHNPDYIVEAVAEYGSFFDLALAGHTHGGQIVFPAVGPVYGYNSFYNKYTHELYEETESKVYVSRGLGVVDIACRLNCPPEVCIFELSS